MTEPKTVTVQILTKEGLAELEWLTALAMEQTWQIHREWCQSDMVPAHPCRTYLDRIAALRTRLGFAEWEPAF